MKTDEAIPSDLQNFLAKFSPEAQELALLTRKRILDIVPDAQEKIYSGWGSLRYGFGDRNKDQFAAIELLTSRVNLEFPMGADLPDPTNVLEGSGKKFRHIKVHSKDILDDKVVEDLLEAAAKLARLLASR